MCEDKQLFLSSSHYAKISLVKWVKWVRYSITPYSLFGFVSWFVAEFHRKLFQPAFLNPNEVEDTGFPLFSLSSMCVLPYIPVHGVILDAVPFIQCFQMWRRMSNLGVEE